jgi:hypothetical protein
MKSFVLMYYEGLKENGRHNICMQMKDVRLRNYGYT